MFQQRSVVYPAFGNEVGLYLAQHLQATLALYITDQPTTNAWLDHGRFICI